MKATKLASGLYEYKGHQILRTESPEWGTTWTIYRVASDGMLIPTESASTLKSAKSYVDWAEEKNWN